jgi:hypothetical protein
MKTEKLVLEEVRKTAASQSYATNALECSKYAALPHGVTCLFQDE